MAFSAKTILIIAVLAVVGYFAYTKLYGGLDTKDVAQLIEMHREADGTRQGIIASRIKTLYNHEEHYGMMVQALNHAYFGTQALAVEVLTAKREREAMGKLFAILKDTSRHPEVTARAAKTFTVMRTKKKPALIKIIERLIELTDDSQPLKVRTAADSALRDLLDTGIVTFGDGVRIRWTEIWADRKPNFRAQ
jgi:hypothetical protein